MGGCCGIKGNVKTGISEYIEMKQSLRSSEVPMTRARELLPFSEIGGVESVGQGGMYALPF